MQKLKPSSYDFANLIDHFGDLYRPIALPLTKGYCWASVEGRLIGCVKLNRVNWYQADLSHLVIHPDFRRQDIATTLIERCLLRAIQLKCRPVQSTICVDNEAAQCLFRKFNFSPGPINVKGLSGCMLQVWSRAV